MQINYLKLKTICLFLATLFLFESCSVYHKESVSLQAAAESNSKIRLVRSNGEKVKLKRIESENSVYYGVYKSRTGLAKIKLDMQDIKSLRIRDETKSIVGTVATIIGLLGLVAFTIYAVTIDDWKKS